MYEILVEVGDKDSRGREYSSWITWDLAHNENKAREKAAQLREKGKATRIVNRDPPKKQKEERRRDYDEEEYE